MIRFRARISYVFIVLALLLAGVTGAHAQTVTFSEVRDAAPGRFFDAATAAVSAANANQLNFGLNTGRDPVTFVSNEFRASTLAFTNRMAEDTMTFVVTAPVGFYVASLTYTQQGVASTARTAQQNGNSQWTVAGFPAIIGEYAGNPTLSSVVDLTALQASSVPVSITVSLFAGPTGDIALTGASVVADIKPLGGVRDGAANGGILNNAPAGGAPAPAADADDNRGRGRDEGEARRGNSGSGRGQGGRESGRGSGR